MNNKLFARIAAAAISFSMLSTVALAADPIATKDDDAKTGSLNFVVEGTDISESSEAQITMMAYLVDDADYTSTSIPEYSNQEIVALDQVAGTEGFGEVVLDYTKLATDKAMVVKLGGSDGTVETYYVKYNKEEETILLGDVNDDGTVDMMDAYYILLFDVGDYDVIIEDGCRQFWDDNDESVVLKTGDVNDDETVDMMDAYYILLYDVGDYDVILEEGCPKFWKD